MAVVLEPPMFNWVNWPDLSLCESHQDGCTEPWIAEIVASLLKASRAETVVELGGFVGTTTAWLALTLETMGGGKLYVSEPDVERTRAIEARLRPLTIPTVQVRIEQIPSPQFIQLFPDKTIGFAWVDDDHQKHHVEQEIVNLWPKMKPGGLMLFHDVCSDGVCQLGPLIRKYGGVALDFPRLGPDGGLGLIQVMH